MPPVSIATKVRRSIIGLSHPPALAVIMTAPPVAALRLQISRAMVVPLYRNEESHGYRDSAARRDRLADLGPPARGHRSRGARGAAGAVRVRPPHRRRDAAEGRARVRARRRRLEPARPRR